MLDLTLAVSADAKRSGDDSSGCALNQTGARGLCRTRRYPAVVVSGVAVSGYGRSCKIKIKT